MGKVIDLTTFTDGRGSLTVLEKLLPFEIKRVYYIYNVDQSIRGGHRHIKTKQAAICITGSCRISIKSCNGCELTDIILDSPTKCLIIDPHDYHWMDKFSDNCVLLVLASEYYESSDYIHEPYK